MRVSVASELWEKLPLNIHFKLGAPLKREEKGTLIEKDKTLISNTWKEALTRD